MKAPYFKASLKIKKKTNNEKIIADQWCSSISLVPDGGGVRKFLIKLMKTLLHT